MLHLVKVVAPTDSTVLIHGETGSGKELVARSVCDLSGRRRKPFIRLNCAAMPAGLLESELFGHENGAFTGANVQRLGRFEVANGGTLFLDEIGDVPLELQPKLLRVLQEQELERLGGTRTVRTDVRIVAATNRDLARMVEEGRFRADRYYRLDVFPVRVPPLREHREDIPLLANSFVMASGRRLNRWFGPIPDALLEALTRYDWRATSASFSTSSSAGPSYRPGASSIFRSTNWRRRVHRPDPRGRPRRMCEPTPPTRR